MPDVFDNLMLEYNKSIVEIAEKALKEIKLDCRTYGELNKEIQKLILSIKYTNPSTLVKVLEMLLLKELNDMPLTSRPD